ncbi:MAG: hypothetical protein MJY82_01440 [Fibrobacter sp.]|nr:hypothetical protein [Fibrobacter sp.]
MQQFPYHDDKTGFNFTNLGNNRIYEPNFYLPKPPKSSIPQEQIFEEYLVVDNIACTTKLKDIGTKGNMFKYNNTENKEVYLFNFRGTWEQLKEDISLLSQLGVSWKRNVEKYSNTLTHFLIMDFDDLNPFGAETLLKAKKDKNILITESASCNYIPVEDGAEIDLSKEWKCKYHVFQLIPNGYELNSKNLFKLTDDFAEKQQNLSEGRDGFVYDTHLCTNCWNVIYSKAPIPEQSKIATNTRYSCEAGQVFDYVDFESLFEHNHSVILTRCTDYVPNANKIKYKDASYDAKDEYKKQINQSKELIKEFNVDTLAKIRQEPSDPLSIKKLLELAGVPEGCSVEFPHFRVGRPRQVKEGNRNGIASLICHLIAFNIYSFEKTFKISGKIKPEDIIKSFNCAFNESNVEYYKDFMRDFNIIKAIEQNKRIDAEYKTVCEKKKHPSIKCTKLRLKARNIHKCLDSDLITIKKFMPSDGVIKVPSTKTAIKQLTKVYTNGIIDENKICRQYEVKDSDVEELIKIKFQEYGIPLPPTKRTETEYFHPFEDILEMEPFIMPTESNPSNRFKHLFEADFILKCEKAKIQRSDATFSHCYPETRAQRSDKGKTHNVHKQNSNKGKSKYDFLMEMSEEEQNEWFKANIKPKDKQKKYYIRGVITGKKQL